MSVWNALAAYRVYRGGSWSFVPQYARVAIRNRVAPGFRDRSLGVRLARRVS